MFSELNVSKVFDERNIVNILLYIYICGPRTRTELYKNVSTNPRMPQKLELLENMRLIKYTTRPPNRREIDLTDLGKKYANSLCQMERLSGGNA
jgi:DNA-binding HxlR family transcriptional regulator